MKTFNELKLWNDMIFVDVPKLGDVELMAAFGAQALGGLDVLVNNAGLSDLPPLSKMAADEWEKVVQMNLNGTFYVTHFAIPT